jgi:two-component system CheB/CheR fusion protein
MFEQTYNAFIAGDDGSYRSEYRFRHGDGDWRWIEGFAQALERDAAGEVRRLVGVILDVTESRQATEERELLARELSHRVKNTLAVVQALARQTDGRIATIEEYREVFLGRLQAMAKAHNHLIEANWRRADLKRLIEQAVAAYCVDHPELVEIKGKRVILTPKQGLGLSLILHELGTNAAKYGALSHHDGRLRIAWEVENAEQKHRVRLTWTERDGPEVVPPDSRGFGTRLIEQASGYELDGEAELRYAPEGFSCALVFPLEVRDER